jgi:hypothetical protein
MHQTAIVSSQRDAPASAIFAIPHKYLFARLQLGRLLFGRQLRAVSPSVLPVFELPENACQKKR